ncbi:MAG: hypothetical protein HWN67_22550, partial [Candidatus Helarchaeota archaeon]|nr:hypothetical protein [Candidatus Helarchaeota archaeon]
KSCPACMFSTLMGAKKAIKFREDVTTEKVEAVKMFNVVGGSVQVTQKLESDNVVLVTDRKDNIIWVWKGKNTSPRAYYAAGTQATKLRTAEKMYGAKIQNIEEGSEPLGFMDLVEESSTDVSEIPSTMTLYRIEGGELKKIDEAVFTSGDAYIVDFIDTIYVWIGKNASVDEKFTGAHVATMIDAVRSGTPKIITVDQGSEPLNFKAKVGVIKIVEKDVAESILSHYEKPVHEPILYRVSSEEYETINDIQYIQVPLSKDSLDSEDVFLLDDRTNDKCYVWVGKDATVREKVVAGRISRKFDVERVGVQYEIFVEEGDEPEDFKKILGME